MLKVFFFMLTSFHFVSKNFCFCFRFLSSHSSQRIHKSMQIKHETFLLRYFFLPCCAFVVGGDEEGWLNVLLNLWFDFCRMRFVVNAYILGMAISFDYLWLCRIQIMSFCVQILSSWGESVLWAFWFIWKSFRHKRLLVLCVIFQITSADYDSSLCGVKHQPREYIYFLFVSDGKKLENK